MAEEELQTYRRCIGQQLEELEMLSSIYCGPGELQMLDAGVVADFNEFLGAATPRNILPSHLEYIVKLSINANQRQDVRIELPHLYPVLEQPRVSVHSPLLGKAKEQHLKIEIEGYLSERREEEPEPYIFQLLSWLQEKIETLLQRPASEFEQPQLKPPEPPQTATHLERLWIYSHHIKSSAKRQELIRQARQLDLTGFSRPGKPGIICVEGLAEQVQQFWRTIKSLRWQKISVVRTEPRQRKRGFDTFTEQLFNEEEGIMNMGQFIKFLEAHGFGYMKSELFGLA
ncbi:GL17149 [Drosophila persimilis]|uniref:GL17149 n=1 Tax=Drosophila persimilis TaxID=7234 RepID=B4GGE9_DROPE|nr:RWD domain-containing protein 2A [Drosophila persimilis]XP_026841299.1 RWD domain-containing protein 2A [Drosophila persimilis]EDW35569.1 GL17149 [Drosophila persimilis]